MARGIEDTSIFKVDGMTTESVGDFENEPFTAKYAILRPSFLKMMF